MKAPIANLSAAEKKALSEFKQTAEQRLGDQVVEMRLFGSRARGQGNEDSDLDVAVIVREESGALARQVYDLAADIFLATEVHVSPLVLSVGKFAWLKSIERGIALAIDREGIKL